MALLSYDTATLIVQIAAESSRDALWPGTQTSGMFLVIAETGKLGQCQTSHLQGPFAF